MTDETITVNGVDYPRKDVQAVTLTIPFDAELIEDQPQIVPSCARKRGVPESAVPYPVHLMNDKHRTYITWAWDLDGTPRTPNPMMIEYGVDVERGMSPWKQDEA